MPCPRTGERVSFMRCGALTFATIIDYDWVSAGIGGSLISGDKLADIRYAACADNGMAIAVCESEIR